MWWNKFLPWRFSKRQWCTLFVIGIADFFNAVCVSLQAPFFPQEAEKKGATATEYGLVFGIFELVVFIASPCYGLLINRIGPKVLFNVGIFTTSVAAILFGLLDRVPDHDTFLALAFTTRTVEALGNAAFLTASFAIIAKEFPDNVATVFACLETFFGFGLIVGPMVGGALYTLGGYFLPFVVLGSSLTAIAFVTLYILPKHTVDNEVNKKPSFCSVIRVPGIIVCGISICATSASIGFLGATLEPHLREFTLTPMMLGVVFVINGGVYALTAPFWGQIVDSYVSPKIVTFLGCLSIAIGFCFIGPVEFLPIPNTIAYCITGLVLQGAGIGAVLVATFKDALNTVIRKGLPNSIETYGLISGIWTCTFALGAFIGPTASGILYDTYGFSRSVLFIIGLHFSVAAIILVFLLLDRAKPQPYKEISPDEPLLRHKETYTLITGKESCFLQRNAAIPCLSGSCNGLAVERPPLSGVNSLFICKSYSQQCSQWSRSENGSCGALYYGSVDGLPTSRLTEGLA